MARQCPKPKRKRDATWFRDKVLLVEAQGSGKVLNKEELEFLADPGVAEGPVTHTVITHNAAYQADNLDAYDSNCDDFSIAKAVLMANLSSCVSDVLSEVSHSENTHNDMLNQSGQEMSYSKQTHLVNYPENEITTYIPEHPGDLVPAEDEAPIEAYIPEVASAPTPPLPPSFLSPCIRPPHTRVAMAQMRATVPSTYHLLLLSGTPPLLPIPLPVPSTNRRAEIPEADMPPQKRLLLTAPRPGCEVGESSAAVARQLGPTMARSVDCSFVDCGT
nr:hypothetical protein [Tanacetum cinerariifolium]